ncbi:hypothetical protein GCM10027422_18270 [Hymenobacter arcticus]
MKEEFKKYSIILTLWTLFSICLWWQYKVSQDTQDVEENGIEVPAKIIGRHYAKGWFTNVEYHYRGKKYAYDIYGTGIPAFVPHIGDSLLIKILPNEPDKLVLVQKRLSSVLPKP